MKENVKPTPAYDSSLVRQDECARYMEEIHEMAVKGESLHAAMGTLLPLPKWEDILLLGAQLDPAPLNDDDPVSTQTIIGKNAKQPMVLESPVYISHMSFGALSKEIKTALAMGSAKAQTAMCSGEGGILPEEKAAAYKYIFEYIPNKYSVTDENLKTSDAIEIKIGQGTKPGMGGHLPGSKVTEEIAAIRGKNVGEDIQSPSKFPEINSKEDLKAMVDMLRERSEGRPIGITLSWRQAILKKTLLTLSLQHRTLSRSMDAAAQRVPARSSSGRQLPFQLFMRFPVHADIWTAFSLTLR